MYSPPSCTLNALRASRAEGIPILDVRAPSEYRRGHIVGALSLPLFSDEERAAVGTTYVRKGEQAAIVQGLGYVGRHMEALATEALASASPQGEVIVYCARGGMRSQSVAWLLETVGLRVRWLEGGYRTYHREMQQIPLQYRLVVLGGGTGCGKTEVLREMAEIGGQVVDLEALACHRGSVFGAIEGQTQPSGEHFLNLLGEAFAPLDPARWVLVEGESAFIGHCALPPQFWHRMQQAPYITYTIPQADRLRRIVADYASQGAEALKQAFGVLRKRMGAVRSREAMEALDRGDYLYAARLALDYYDKAYHKTNPINPVWELSPRQDDPRRSAMEICSWIEKYL